MGRPIQFSLQRLLGSILLFGISLALLRLAQALPTGRPIVVIAVGTLLCSAVENVLGRALLGFFTTPIACYALPVIRDEPLGLSSLLPWLLGVYLIVSVVCFCGRD